MTFFLEKDDNFKLHQQESFTFSKANHRNKQLKPIEP